MHMCKCMCIFCLNLLGVSVPLLTEDVLVEGLVLRLYGLVSRLICHDLAWVFHTYAGALANSSKLVLMCQLVLRELGATLAILGGIVEFASGSVCKANTVTLCDLAVDFLHGKCEFYFCHSCSAIEHTSKTRDELTT